MLKKRLLPMNLQLFADQEEMVEEVDETTVVEEQTEQVDSDKIVEKLQKRLGKETHEKNETKEQLTQALTRIEELEKGNKKGVKEQSDEEKEVEAKKAKDSEIEELRRTIKLQEVTSEVDEVLKESGFALNKEELALVVSSDEEKSYSNVKTLINLINRDRERQAVIRNTGVTPKKVTESNTSVSQDQFNAMSYAEKAKLAETNPEQFKKITGGL